MLACFCTGRHGGLNLLNFKSCAELEWITEGGLPYWELQNGKELYKTLESWSIKIKWTFPHFFHLMWTNGPYSSKAEKNWALLPLQPKESMILSSCDSEVLGTPESKWETWEKNMTFPSFGVFHFNYDAIYPVIQAWKIGNHRKLFSPLLLLPQWLPSPVAPVSPIFPHCNHFSRQWELWPKVLPYSPNQALCLKLHSTCFSPFTHLSVNACFRIQQVKEMI